MSPALPEEERTPSSVAGVAAANSNSTPSTNNASTAWRNNNNNNHTTRIHRPSLAVLGTGSDVGKSVIAAGLCRLLANHGKRVAPFKAQNMSNNSHPALISASGTDSVTECTGNSNSNSNSNSNNGNSIRTSSHGGGAWGEIGVAQAVQAEACRLVPRVEMNPLLLKSGGRRGGTGEYLCSVVVLGRHLCTEDYGALGHRTNELRTLVLDAHYRLGCVTDAECIVLEGAGSCTELNLVDRDVVNLPLVRQLNCPWLLVANIDPGGVFAQIVGTKACVSEHDWDLCAGIVVNKLRGETKYFEPGPRMIRDMVGGDKPVFVVPYKYDLNLPEEDGLGVERRLAKEHLLSSSSSSTTSTATSTSTSTSTATATSSTGNNKSDDAANAKIPTKKPIVVVLAYPHVAITSDLTPLESDPAWTVEWRRHVLPDAPYPHVTAIILPGSRLTRTDLDWLNGTPWWDFLKQHAAAGGAILGLCGGYQMLGRTVADPDGVEGAPGVSAGLGLLPVETTIATASCKIVTPRAGVLYQARRKVDVEADADADADGHDAIADQQALSVEGFELHCGRTAKITNNKNDDGHGGGTADAPPQPLVVFTDDISQMTGTYDTHDGDKGKNEDATDEEGMRLGNVCGTYLHGILAKRRVRRALLLGADILHDTDNHKKEDDDEPEEVDSLDLFANHLADCGLDFETVSNMIKW
jgi:adenosylcobyric acid synthase